jgi:hypothetical protein
MSASASRENDDRPIMTRQIDRYVPRSLTRTRVND